MNRPRTLSSQPDDDARRRQESRESKPTSQWTAEERREAFIQGRKAERERAEAGIVEEWKLCETCHDRRRERGRLWCEHCIEEMRKFED